MTVSNFSHSPTVLDRKARSETRIKEFGSRIRKSQEVSPFSDLTIFVAGSYARKEAGEYSDIDVFFLRSDDSNATPHSKINEISLFSKIIEIANVMSFPALSNDGEFLQLLSLNEALNCLGGRDDDHKNHFTTRMLLLLESRPMYNSDVYWLSIKRIVESYFRDYPDHVTDFRPIFLVNDICRFWKTLCLNYEHKRNQPATDEIKKRKQKIKNFKLKFSRMLTCFASIIYLTTFKEPIKHIDVKNMIEMTPTERLIYVSEVRHDLADDVSRALDEYLWFLEKTGLSTDNLHEWFSDKENVGNAFARADKFGGTLFSLLRGTSEANDYMRYIVI